MKTYAFALAFAFSLLAEHGALANKTPTSSLRGGASKDEKVLVQQDKMEPVGDKHNANERVLRARPQYVGCYKDNEDRVMETFLGNLYNIETCVAACRQQGYALAGLEWYDECFCGNSFGHMEAGTECNTPCSNGTGMCGGPWHLSLYRTGETTGESSSCKTDGYSQHDPNTECCNGYYDVQTCNQDKSVCLCIARGW